MNLASEYCKYLTAIRGGIDPLKQMQLISKLMTIIQQDRQAGYKYKAKLMLWLERDYEKALDKWYENNN